MSYLIQLNHFLQGHRGAFQSFFVQWPFTMHLRQLWALLPDAKISERPYSALALSAAAVSFSSVPSLLIVKYVCTKGRVCSDILEVRNVQEA